MQVHEITLNQKTQIDEGLLDRAKQMGQQAHTAVQKAAPHVKNAALAAGDYANKAATRLEPHLQRAGDYAGQVAKSSAPARMAQSAKQTMANVGQGKGTTMKQEYQIQELAGKAQAAWDGFVAKYSGSLDPEEKEAYLSGSDGLMEDQLTEFVERNLLGKKQIERFANASKIQSIIQQICTVSEEPTNATTSSNYSAASVPPPPRHTQPEDAGDFKAYLQGRVKAGTMTKDQALRQWNKFINNVWQPSHMANVQQAVDKQARERKAVKPVTPAGVKQTLAPSGFNDWVKGSNGVQREDIIDESIGSPEERELFVSLIRQTSLATPARRSAPTRPQADRYSNEENVVDSTGNPKADAILKAAGFKIA